ncbi:MAG: hypothetical protein ACQEW8_07170 [Actinomycetota bacterium]
MTLPPLPFSVEVLLSLQGAMLGEVLPTLRAVAVAVDYPEVRARFIYERLGQRELWITNDIETYVIADFVPPVNVECEAVELDIRTERSPLEGEVWVYQRYEEPRGRAAS